MVYSFEFTKDFGYINKNKKTKNLIGKKIEFTDKVNILFGDNGSGKSSILRAIGAEALTRDGWTNPYMAEPLDFMSWFFDKKETVEELVENLKKYIINKIAYNSFNVDWDGIPIYYDNFSSRQGFSFGDFTGSVLENGTEELNYHLNKNRMSKGQLSIFLFNKLMKQCTKYLTLDDLYSGFENKMKYANDSFQRCYEAQRRYLYSHIKENNSTTCNTFLFDEIDKSFSIKNVYLLYSEVIPKLYEATRNQIILVSHNPIILSNVISDRKDIYNVISLNRNYTAESRKILEIIQFGRK